MGYDNNITVSGNMTRDPELRFSQAGMPIATFGLAWNKRRPDGEDEVSFFNVTCFRQLADNVAESLKKGSRVMVHGTLSQRRWDAPDGGARSAVEIIAEDIGPSLKWATAEIHKNEYRGDSANGGGRQGRNSGGRSYGRGPDKDDGSRSQTARSRPSSTHRDTASVGSVDEEPF